MKKIYFKNLTICYLFLILLTSAFTGNAQVIKPFKERTSPYSNFTTIHKIKGNFTMIGNTNLTLQNYGSGTTNGNNSMSYVDVDNVSSTFNSSSATLRLLADDNVTELTSCYTIVFAGLYWTGRVSDNNDTEEFDAKKGNVTKKLNKRKILFKKGNNAYQQFTAAANDIYFPTTGDGRMFTAYAEVTDYVKTNGIGEYFAADIAALQGSGGGNIGKYAGWGLVVIYENSNMKNRDITVFDGHAYVRESQTLSYTIPVSGFNSVTSGAVGIKLGVMAGEGDVNYDGDYFQIQKLNSANYLSLSRTGNTTNNFFNSSINTGGNARNPNLSNNSGIDISMFDLPNTNKDIIGNNQTSTTFKYGSTIDTYTIFSIVMAVDAYVPEIEGTLTASTINGSPAGAGPYTVLPGQELGYKIQIKNKGTEAIQNSKIVIPIPYNATYVPGSAVKTISFTPLPTPNSLTFEPTTGANGSLVWDIGTLPLTVNKETVLAELTFKLKSTENCALLKNANCSNVIQVNGQLSGQGANSTVTVTNKPLILGYTAGGSCVGTSISAPLQTTIDAAAYIITNCQSTPPVIPFTFCNGAAAIQITDVTGSFPTGSSFYNQYPVAAGTTQYTINNAFPATIGTSTYYAVPPGAASGCYFPFTITIESITTKPTVNSPVNYCIGDTAVPLTATPTNAQYTLYYYETANSTAQHSFTPPTNIAGQFTYYAAEGKTNACIGPKTAIVVNINSKPAVTITNPLPICAPAATANLTDSAITAGSTSGLTFTYWTNAAATIPYADYATAVPGTYYIKGTNTANCYEIKPVVVSKSTISVTELTASHVDVSCKSKLTGSITVNNAAGGTAPYTYSWKKNGSPYTGTIQTLNSLGAGSYEITATDANGCSGSLTIAILEPNLALELALSSKTDVLCHGKSTGTITAGTVTNAVGTVTYSWKNALNEEVGNTAVVSNLPAGTYTLTVSDACSSQTNSVTIIQPNACLALGDSSKTDVLCHGKSTGTITAGTVTNAVGTVVYSWKNASNDEVGNTQTVSNLPAGKYILTVSDDCSSQTNSVTIIQPNACLALGDSSKTDVSCYGENTGTITAGTVTNAVGTILYSWKNASNDEVGNTQTVSDLPAGTYTLTVSDTCSSQTNSVTITQPNAVLSCSIIQNKAVSSNGLSNGEATVTAIGGNGDYTYLWDNNETGNKAVLLSAGLHTVTVTDVKGCKTTCSINITEPNVLSCSIIQDQSVGCYGGNTGKATITAIGGNGDYTYLWDNQETTVQAVTLTAGLHTVVVTDKLGYTTTCTVNIIQPQAPLTAAINSKTDVNCKNDATGSAVASASGGTGTYSYSWNTNPVQTLATATNLIAGTYTVTVTDEKGCTAFESITIKEPELALTASKSQNNPICGGAATGTASVVVSGGTSPYTYSWNTNPVQTSAAANNLIAGTYKVTITDSKGCTHTESFEILDGDTVKPVINPLPEVSTINCPAEPVFAEAAATDNNGTIFSLTFEDIVITGNCAGSYTKTRTWTAKDACGNISLPVSQIIIVQDITAPTWTTLAASLNKTIECSNTQALASAQALFPIALDTCDADVTNLEKISGSFIASKDCANTGTYTNTWTVKDDCGNISDIFKQVITIQDTTAPTFAGELPADSTVSCDAVPQPANLEAVDNCNENLPIVFSEIKSGIQNQCGTNYTLTRKWTTSDCAGNTAVYTQILKVEDKTPPTGTAPADVSNLESIDAIPVGNPAAIKDAADNCSENVSITISDSNNGGSGCEGSPFILTRTYTLADCAGNKTELVQTFTVENKVSVSGIATSVSCLGGKDGSILVTNSPGSTVVIRNDKNEVVGNTNLPAGTYTLTASSAVNNQNQICTAAATVVITQPDYKVKISGYVMNADNHTGIANVPVTLIPQTPTTGPILLRLTGTDGSYSFSGMPAGKYLVQVQDANLNSAYQLYPKDSSLFFTTLEECVIQQHNFEYESSTLPVLGDYVWYDTNNNGLQDEWYDANNDGIVTKNVPDANGAIDYSLWEWIDFNGDGSYKGASNAGELNAGGFGNALSSNVIIDGPNGYHEEVIVGIQGFWRNRPETPNPYGDYTIKLVRDANLDAVAAALGATGLVKVLPNAADKKITAKTGKTQLHTVCQTTSNSSYIVTIKPEDLVHLDIDFGVNCKTYSDIIANDDSAGPFAGVNHITKNVLNVLPNDTIEGVVVTPSDVIITTVTPNEFLQLNSDGSVDVLANAPVGTLTLVYQICEADQTSNCDTATVTITIEAPVMTVTATAICVNDVPYIDYVVTPVNFTPVNGVTIAWANTANTIITTMTDLPLKGRVLWPGAVVDENGHGIDWPGWVFENNKWIQAPDGFESLRPTANLTISVNPSETITVNYPPADPYCTARPTFTIVANDDNGGPVTGPAGVPNILNVYNNDSLNGGAVNPNDVTLTTVTPDPKGALTLNPDGSVDVAPNTPAGTYTLIYQICEKAHFGNCDTAIVTVIVKDAAAPPTPVIANDDNYLDISCNKFGLVGNVLSNDFKGLLPATLELVDFTLLAENNNEAKTNPNITIDISGNVKVSSLTPAGTYIYSYRICDKLSADNCDTAIVTIVVLPTASSNINSTACNGDSTLINLSDLLPAGTLTTGIWVDTNSTNALQGNIFNPLGMALGNYKFEYQIADENCPRNIVLNMEINDDCKVLACGNIVVHNAFSPNGDGLNDVFTIDSIDDLTCYPENNVEIYNRWGVLIFETNNYNNTSNAFDGTSRGRTTVKQSDKLPTGTYFYIVNYKSLDGNNVLQNNKKDGYLYLSK